MKPNVTAPRGRAVQTWHHDPAPFSHAAMARTIEFIMYHPPLGPGAIRTTMNKTQRWTGACSAQPRMDMATKNVRRSTRALETRTANQQNLPARDRPIVTINLAVFVPSYQVLYRLSPRCCLNQMNGSAKGSRARSEYAHHAAPSTKTSYGSCSDDFRTITRDERLSREAKCLSAQPL
jgi:hypothetical protein